MNLFSYLEELRQKPDATKHLIALWSSVGITLVISLLWLSFVTISPLAQNQQASVQEASGQKNIFIDIYEKIKAGAETIIESAQ